jgi:hypothetical protein
LLGIAIGAIPLAIWLGTLGIAFGVRRPPGPGPYVNLSFLFDGLALAGLAYLVMIVAALGLAANERTRVVGMGALAALLASPVIAFMGCSVIPNMLQ